ncbi:hypothetical protein H2203_001541 [Taxawa tesnikishii (nom. ined.)]|nr:hypothetical protein H2203_001541 [Dothideales sp. JES 119]
MAAVEATIHVQACILSAHDHETIVESSDLAPLTSFIQRCAPAPDSSGSGDSQPPAKRRRIDSNTTSSCDVHPSEIPLVKVTLNLELDGVSQHGSIPDRTTIPPWQYVDVRLDNVGSRSFMLYGLDSQRKCPHVTFRATSELPQSVFENLRNISMLQKRAKKNSSELLARPGCQLQSFINSNGVSFKLECFILWRDGESAFGALGTRAGTDLELLSRYFPSTVPVMSRPWTPQEFYDTVYSPASDTPIPVCLDVDALATALYPFQKRAVRWMLEREGLVYKNDRFEPASHDDRKEPAAFDSFKNERDANGQECFVSHLQGVVASRGQLKSLTELKGGILAEEMGLGKTCELIALACLNRRTSTAALELLEGLKPSRATLICTPPAILQQWKDELAKHAPSLAVMEYRGVSVETKSQEDEEQLLHSLTDKDVILTTYNILAKEVHFAVDPPERSLRKRKKERPRRRSPLVRMHWWRVVLDEAQQVESGVSAAATVAALLPREHAWAVTGTPLKGRPGSPRPSDLPSLSTILQFCEDLEQTHRFVQGRLQEIVRTYHPQTYKNKVRQELRLPPQKRVVITMPFNAVEEQNYRTLFKEMCEDCGCSVGGAPLHDDWDPNSPTLVEKMRKWLVRLRQTCLHPQVGGRNRRALGRGSGPLRTVAEVLEVMIEQNEVTTRTEARTYILQQLLRGHIVGNVRTDERRSEKALEQYRAALHSSDELVTECRAQLQETEASVDPAGAREEDREEDEDDAPEQAIKGALELQHASLFFTATAFYQIKSNEAVTEPDSEEYQRLEEQEALFYDKAKMVRRELLRETASKAEKLMRKISLNKSGSGLVRISEVSPLDTSGGIENRKVVYKLDDLIGIFRKQAEFIVDWREKVVELMLKPLVDEDEGAETTGEEYEDSTQQQDRLYVYVDALRAIVADRSTCLTGLPNPLIDHEMNLLQKEASEEKAKLQSVQAAESKVLIGLEKELDLFRSTMNQRLEFYRQLQHVSDQVAPYKDELDGDLDTAALNVATAKEEFSKKKLAECKTKHRFLLHLRDESSNQEGQKTCVICQCPFEQGILTVCGHQYCKECIQTWWAHHRTCPVCKRHLTHADFHPITYKPQELRAQEEIRSEPSSPERADPAKSIYSDISSDTLAQIKSIDLNGSFGTKIDTLARHVLWIRHNDPGAKSVVFSQYRDFLDVLSGALGQFGIGYSRMGKPGAVEKFRNNPAVECFLLDAKTDSSGLNLVNAQYVLLCEPLINPAIELQAIARVHRIGQQRPTTVFMYLISDTVEEAIYECSVKRRLAHMQQNRVKSRSVTPTLAENTLDAANSMEMQQAPLSTLLVQGKGEGEVVRADDLWNCLFDKVQGADDAHTRAEFDRNLRATAADIRRQEG